MADIAFGRDSVITSIEGGTATQVSQVSDPEGTRQPREKYEVSATIGAGGMGEVLLVKDRDLRREIAMKVMKRSMAVLNEHRVKFVAEAQATSQLEHPGIPPVHDLGLTPDGSPYFTMKLVRGQTLRDVLHNLLVGRKEYRQEFTLHRLTTVLERICEALHFAHEKGVLHRDLKPENIMLGDFGEVHVMDWGIARVRGEKVDPEEQVGTEGTDAGLMTVDGSIKGTVPYMSPEQAMGRVTSMDRRSDVWSLGCILYEMLTLHMAFEGVGLLARVRRGEFPSVRTRNTRRPVPEDLAILCERCLTVDPAGRPASARDLGMALRKWLDGTAEKERAHEIAEKLVLQGTLGAAANYNRLKEELLAAERIAKEQAGTFLPGQGVEECLPMLEAREKVRATRRAMLQAFSRATTYLEAALLAEESNAAAREALGSLWRARLADAEQQGNREEADYALDMMVRYDDANLARVISGEGSLFLTSEPPGAEVVLHR